MVKDLHREDQEIATKIRVLLRLGLFDHAKILSVEIYKTFELKSIVYNDITYTRFHGLTWNGAVDSLPSHLTPVKRKC